MAGMWNRLGNGGFRDYGLDDYSSLGGGLRGVLDRNHQRNAYGRYPNFGAAEWARNGGWAGSAGAERYGQWQARNAGLRYAPQLRGWGFGSGGPPTTGGFF
ncbi:hypothetical protein HII31_01669 [Pseudocercospora fuligena]|uniref:Uncharacterized protein n=1 Tax=Pseudocercospora fuligena TaxID=685502 RepID=A0A8H6RTK3_9PEZI|nr:hypothetical protein HII31_01669 [Pseudocercospora fuligena]